MAAGGGKAGGVSVSPLPPTPVPLLPPPLVGGIKLGQVCSGAAAFLGGLEDHLHRPRQPVFHPRKRRGRPEQNRHVVVMSAGVHHTDVLTVPSRSGG